MAHVISEHTELHTPTAVVAGNGLWLEAAEAERATGFALKPEGFCKGELCVPVPRGREAEFSSDTPSGKRINVAALWRHLGQPVAHDNAHQIWVLGTASAVRSQQLRSLEAPDFALPDLQGKTHRLSDHRGRRVLVTSWASW